MIEEYVQCAEVCAAIDYSDMSTVRANNRAVDRMYEIVEAAAAQGAQAVAALYPLLDHPVAAKWIAHQLVERAAPSADVIAKCFAVVEELASRADDVEAFGEQTWLRDWAHKRKQNT